MTQALYIQVTKDCLTGVKAMRGGANKLHRGLIAGLEVWQKHGNVAGFTDLANRIYSEDMPFANKASLAHWFVNRGLVFDPSEKVFIYEATRTTNGETLAEVERWDASKAAPEYKPFDLDKAIASLIKIADKHTSKPHDLDNLDPLKVEMLRRLVTWGTIDVRDGVALAEES